MRKTRLLIKQAYRSIFRGAKRWTITIYYCSMPKICTELEFKNFQIAQLSESRLLSFWLKKWTKNKRRFKSWMRQVTCILPWMNNLSFLGIRDCQRNFLRNNLSWGQEHSKLISLGTSNKPTQLMLLTSWHDSLLRALFDSFKLKLKIVLIFIWSSGIIWKMTGLTWLNLENAEQE